MLPKGFPQGVMGAAMNLVLCGGLLKGVWLVKVAQRVHWKAIMDPSEPLLPCEDAAMLEARPGKFWKRSGWRKAALSVVCPIEAGCWSGVVCLVFAQLQIAIHGHLFKILVDEGIPQFQLLFFRSLSNTVLSLVTGLAIAHRRKLLLPKSIWLLSSMQGIFGNLGMIAFYISFTFMVEGDAMALIKLSPIFAFLLNCFLGWEPVTLQIASGVIICCVGGVIIEHPPFLFGGSTWDSSQMIGCGIALFSALFLALLFIATGKVGSRANTITLVLWFHFTGIFINATPLIANISSEQVFTPTRWNLLLLLAFCILSFTSACLNFRGIQLCNATLGTSLQTSAVIFSYMLGYWFLGEKITMFAIAGTAAIFLGILVIAHGKERLHKAGGTIGKIEDIGP